MFLCFSLFRLRLLTVCVICLSSVWSATGFLLGPFAVTAVDCGCWPPFPRWPLAIVEVGLDYTETSRREFRAEGKDRTGQCSPILVCYSNLHTIYNNTRLSGRENKKRLWLRKSLIVTQQRRTARVATQREKKAQNGGHSVVSRSSDITITHKPSKFARPIRVK